MKYTKRVADARNHLGERPWDLEKWECVLPTYNAPKPEEVPYNATRDYGFLRNGEQVVVFRRLVKRDAP
jgi:hypothetical protein